MVRGEGACEWVGDIGERVSERAREACGGSCFVRGSSLVGNWGRG